MSETVLVTGGFGLVGSATVRQLAADGRPVVATDLGTAANRKAAEALPAGVQARWADLTDPAEVDRLVAEAAPAAVIHLAAVIPPGIYRNAKLARKVNVDATATLVSAVAANADPPRFVRRRVTPAMAPATPTAMTNRSARIPRQNRATCTADTSSKPKKKPKKLCGHRIWSGWCCGSAVC